MEKWMKYGGGYSVTSDEQEREIVTQVSIKSNNPNWNPVFNSLKVGPDDEGGGSYLKISGEDDDGEVIKLDWEEWDTLVKVVAKYRKDWEYDKGTPV